MIWWFIMVFAVPIGYCFLFVDPANYHMAAWITFWYWVFLHVLWLITD
jgi:hypothetical protein